MSWEIEYDDEGIPDPEEIYEKPYHILLDGVSDTLRLLHGKEEDNYPRFAYEKSRLIAGD